MKMSKGELKISQLLRENGYNFTQEQSFQDLHKGIYHFDFYLPDLCGRRAVIEYNGEQHYQFNSYFFKNRLDFLHQQNNDRRKISYCLANQIDIYCIPY